MAKSKAVQKQRSSAGTNATPGGRKPTEELATLTVGIPQARSATYEQCMKAYRWASKRYRKTLDALAK